MKRLDDLRIAVEQQLDAVLEGLRVLAGMAQPGKVAVAVQPVRVPCPYCRQLVTPGATVCRSCRRQQPASP
jgi:hypothetical protein